MPTTTQRLARAGSLFSLALAALLAVDAAPPPAGNKRLAACTSDVFRLCNNEVPRVDHMISCLKKSRSILSPDCRATVSERN